MRNFFYRRYSLYGYRQVDGRSVFGFTPYTQTDALLVNVRQLAIYYNVKADANLVLLSWVEGFIITLDARYKVEGTLRRDAPQVLMIRGGVVRIEPLAVDYFLAGRKEC